MFSHIQSFVIVLKVFGFSIFFIWIGRWCIQKVAFISWQCLIFIYFFRSYSYYIEVSMDQKDWVKVVDHSKYLCRSWQDLYFTPRVVRYIRIVGTYNTLNKVFHVVSLEAYYTKKTFQVHKGILSKHYFLSGMFFVP